MNTFLFDLQRFVYIYNNEDDTLLSGTKDNDEIDNEDGSKVTIDAGDGDDDISNGGSNVTIDAGDGDDDIYNYGSNSSISAGAGNDYIENDGDNLTINAGGGDDSIETYGDMVSIDAGAGDDSITNSGDNVTITAGAGNDKIYNEGKGVSIKGGEGSDTIQVYAADVTVDGGAGNDYIESEENEYWYGYNLITGGAGNDTIYTTVIEGYNTLTGGAGADLFIYELYRNEEGSDTITDYAEEDTIKFNSAIDTVLTTGSDSVIFELGWHRLVLQNAADKIITYIDQNGTKKTFKKVPTNPELITLTEGDDEYSNYLEGATIDALGGNDYIFNEFSSKVSISSGTGNDTIENGEDGTGSTLDGGGGNDYIWNTVSQVTIDAGSGNDSITNIRGSDVSIDGGGGNDSVSNSGDSVTIDASDGNDSISNHGDSVTIDAGAGNDYVYNSSFKSTIDAGTGDDYIFSFNSKAKINGGAGNDTLYVYSYSEGSDNTLTGGKGSDLFILYYNASIVSTDTITDYSEEDMIQFENDATINKISTNSSGSVIFKVGDSKLVVKNAADKVVTYYDSTGTKQTYSGGGSSADTWKLDGTTATYGSLTVKGVTSLDGLKVSGKTVTVSAASLGTNKVTISDGYTLKLGSDVSSASTKNSWSLSKTTATYKQTTTAGYSLEDNAITYTKKATKTLVTVKGVTSTDGLKVSGKTVTVSKASLGTNKVTISDGYTLKLGDVDKTSTKKSWTLKNSTATYKQTTTAGYSLEDNEITYTKKATKTLVTVKGVTSTDGLEVSGKTVTVSKASLGTNKVTISDGYTLKLGDVDKTSTKKSWTLKNSSATYKQTTTAGYSLEDNAINYTKKSSKTLATVKGVNDKSGLKVSGSTVKLAASALSQKVTVSGAYTFDFASDYSKATITGSSSDDTIIARGKKVLVKGGKGADTIQLLGTGTLTGGAGNDTFILKSSGTITDYEEGDKISLSSAANISTDGSDLIFNGKVTVTGAADKAVTYIEGGVEKIYEPEEDKAVEFNAKGTAVTLNVTYEEDRFDLTDYPAYKNKVITIKASAVKHSLEINGNKNANKITGTSEDDIIDGKEGGDTIGGGAGNDSIVGGKGNDSLNGGANNDSLWGGIGDDTLVGGVGEDAFIYQDGDGKDVIADYAPGIDKVMILSGEVKSPTADTSGDVTFQIGKGQITFTDSAKKYIELVDPSGNRLGRYNPN